MRFTNRQNELLVFCLWVSVALLVLAAPAAARSAAGRLDPSFGNAGWAVTPPGTAGEGAVQLLLASDGAPVLAELGEVEILRLLSDGAIDESFGANGRLDLGLATANEGDQGRSFFASSVAIDSMGRLVLFGIQSDSAQSIPFFGMPSGRASSYAVG